MDHSVLGNDSFKQSLLRHVETAEKHLEESRLLLSRATNIFNAAQFSVTNAEKRLENLKQATESITDDIFWFTILDEIRKGMIFGPIWRRVGQNQLQSLLG